MTIEEMERELRAIADKLAANRAMHERVRLQVKKIIIQSGADVMATELDANILRAIYPQLVWKRDGHRKSP